MSIWMDLAALAFLLAPGIGLTLALFSPGRLSLVGQAAVAMPIGYSVVALEGLLLAVLHVMTRPAFIAGYAVATAIAWFFGLRRQGLGARVREWRSEVTAEPWVYAVWAVLMVAFGAVRLTFFPELNLVSQTALRYWADGVEIADAHRIPALSLQWGHLHPTTVGKVALNAFDAGMSFVFGRGPLGPMGAVLFAVSVGIALAAFGLARELGLRLTAGLVVLLLFANQVIGSRALSNDLQVFRAETFGRLVVIGALLLAVRAFRSGSFAQGRREAMLSGGLFGVAAGTHLVAFVVGLAMAGAYALARIAFDRHPARVLKVGGATLGVAAAVGAAVLLAPGGTLGFQGSADAGAYSRIASDLRLPKGFDATKYLASGRLAQPVHRRAGAFYTAPSKVAGELIRRVSGTRKLQRRYLWIVPALGIAALALALWAGTNDLRATVVSAVLLAMVLLAAALYFTYRYDVYALAQFGPRRLFDYIALPAALVVLAAVETLLLMLGRSPAAASRPWLASVAGAVLVIVVAAAMLPRDVAPRSDRGPLASALGPLGWIERNVPCSGRILADRRTLATFELLSRHAGALEGMGPFLRPDVLESAVGQMITARAFFDDPSAGLAYLQRNGIAAVVVTGPLQDIGGAFKLGPVNQASMSSAPFLRLAARSGATSVYRVAGYSPAWSSAFPSVVDRPGYECKDAE